MLLLKNGTVLTMADEGIIEQGDVLIDGGKIVEIGVNLPEKDCEVLDMKGKIVMPGMIDAHAHRSNFPENGQWNTDDRIQRNHTNRNKPFGKPRRSEPGEAGSGRTFTDFPCLHGLRRAFRKNMDKIHTSGPITSSEAGRS